LGNVVGRFSSSGSVIAHYTYGLGLVSQVNSAGASSYYDFDALGSVVALTNTAGLNGNTYSYLSFGETMTISGTMANPFQFVGKRGVQAEANGLDYMRARTYASQIGKFVAADPLGILGGTCYTSYGYNTNGALASSCTSQYGANGSLDAAFSGMSLQGAAGTTISGAVAGFNGTDGNAADYSATINWGDGTVSSGIVSVASSAGFNISGLHTYTDAGSYIIAVPVTEASGVQVTIWATATVISSLSQSSVSVSAATINVGHTTTVTLAARDALGNPEDTGGLQVAFGLGTGSGTFGAVTDNGDGTYTTTFT
jgi:RHS repeat-associated protein